MRVGPMPEMALSAMMVTKNTRLKIVDKARILEEGIWIESVRNCETGTESSCLDDTLLDVHVITWIPISTHQPRCLQPPGIHRSPCH